MIFTTWFTYDASGKAMWLSMSAFRTGAHDVLRHALSNDAVRRSKRFRSTATRCSASRSGARSLSFTDGSNGTFAYTVNGVAQTQADHAPRIRPAADLHVRRPKQSGARDQLPGQLVVRRRGRIGLGDLLHPPGRQPLRELVHLRQRRHADVAVGNGGKNSQRDLQRNLVPHDRARVPLRPVRSASRRPCTRWARSR